MVNSYIDGQIVIVSGAFTDANGTPLDPTVVKLSYKVGSGTVTTLTYLTDVALVKDSTGVYHANIDTTGQKGTLYYRWYSTGTGQAADEDAFLVTSQF